MKNILYTGLLLIVTNIWFTAYIAQTPNYEGINTNRNDCERASDFECFDMEGLWPPWIENQSLPINEQWEYFEVQPTPTPTTDPYSTTTPSTNTEWSLSSLAIWIVVWILLIVILAIVTYYRMNKK